MNHVSPTEYSDLIAEALLLDLVSAATKFPLQSELPLAALAVFTDDSGAPIFIMGEFSDTGFSKEEPGYYSGMSLGDAFDGRPFQVDPLMDQVRLLETQPYEDCGSIVIRGLEKGVRLFSETGLFSSDLTRERMLLMLWVHDTACYAENVLRSVHDCNPEPVARWFEANYCYRPRRFGPQWTP